MPSRKEWLVDGLAEREEGFLKSKDRSKISNCISHTFCWPCCSYSHLTAMMLMMQVFLSVTHCHCAYGFWSYKQTQYLHLQMSSNPRRTDVMFLCNIWHHSTQNTVSHHRRPKTQILVLVLLIGCGETWFICLTFSPQAVFVAGTLMLAYLSLMPQTLAF